MADCYYHGYSGGPGPCSECAEERKQRLELGSLEGFDPSLAADVIRGPEFHPDPSVRQPKKT